MFQLINLGALLFLAHCWLIGPVLQNGDAAVYNEQIERHILGARTTHIGYILLGIAFDGLLPFDVERNLNLMSLFFASVGGASLASIARRLGSGVWLAVTAPVLAFGLRPYLFGAVLAEVDVTACALVLLGLALWMHCRTIAAAVAFGTAMLVTPLASLSVPLFILTWDETCERRLLSHVKRLTIFTLISSVTYLPLVIAYRQDYWLGGRGIFNAPRQPWSVADQVTRSVEFFKDAASPWLLLALAGLILAARARKPLVYGELAAIILAAVVGERFLDIPVQLPQLCLLSAFAVLAAAKVPRPPLALLALAACWITAAPRVYLSVADAVATRIRTRSTYLEMAKLTPKLIVAGLPSSWDDGLPFERIVYRKTKLGLGLDTAQFCHSASTIARRRREYAIWVMSPVSQCTTVAFASGWRRETRTVLGKPYDVWIPMSPISAK